jgi:hypothetical protein
MALPFQTVETVNESAQDRQHAFSFGPGFREEEWRNRLIWGDKKCVLPSLLAEFAGKVNLIYIDPPFDTGAEFGKGGSQTAARQRACIDFIVKLANATPLDGYAWLHGVRGRTHGSCRSCRRAGQRRGRDANRGGIQACGRDG